jgi:hypothetical protein
MDWKFLVSAALAAWVAASCSACGATYNGLTVGTTGFLQEANRTAVARRSNLAAVDRDQLAELIARKTGGNSDAK